MRLLLFGLLFLSGCTTTVIPPSSSADPITIQLLDHGRHPSLIIPLPDGTSVRYAYGDWGWYALGHTGVIQAFDALLLPSHGAIGRKLLATADDFESMRRLDPAEHVYYITVERSRAEALHQTLDEVFRQRQSTGHFNADFDLEFVPSNDNYWALHNCNQVMANWLGALGCHVRGTAIFSDWRIR